MIRLKNETQLEGIRKSCNLLSLLYKELIPRIKPGITTLELDQFAYGFVMDHGAKPAFLGYGEKDNPFPGTLCISINEEVIHGIPGKRVIKEGDVVSIDSGTDLNGYFSDAAFTVAMPPVDDKISKLLANTKKCLELGIAQVKPGNRVHDISRAVFAYAKAAGLGVVRQYCGHGVGLSQHEEPNVPNYVSGESNPRLVPGMVIAIEPMITTGSDNVKVLRDNWTVVTMDKSIAAHFEHTVAVTKTGVEVLTAWQC